MVQPTLLNMSSIERVPILDSGAVSNICPDVTKFSLLRLAKNEQEKETLGVIVGVGGTRTQISGIGVIAEEVRLLDGTTKTMVSISKYFMKISN